MYLFDYFYILIILLHSFHTIHSDDKSKVKVRKDPLDFTENDINNLFEEWEENDEEILPEDERHDFLLRNPYGKHKPPNIRPEDIVGQDPENIAKMTKRGQQLMMFATVSGNPTRRETDEITQIWWAGLKNALFDVTKYIVDDSRILFLLQDGSQAYDVKNYLIQQDRCLEVTIDNRQYPGKGAQKPKQNSRKDL